MKIEIDTKHDSPEEIKKVIKMLQHLVGQDPYTNTPNIFEDSPSAQAEPSNAFLNMFGDSSKGPKEEPMDEPEEKPKQQKEPIPQIIPY